MLNMIDLVHKYDRLQSKRRIKAVLKMKREMQRRFLNLFKKFRLKKHGEIYVNKKEDYEILSTFKTKSLIETDGKINSKLDQIEKYLMNATERYSDFHQLRNFLDKAIK